MQYDERRRPARDIRIDGRDITQLEDALFEAMASNCEREYSRNTIDRGTLELVIDTLQHHALGQLCQSFLRDTRGQPDYFLSEIYNWAESVAPDFVRYCVDEYIAEQERAQQRRIPIHDYGYRNNSPYYQDNRRDQYYGGGGGGRMNITFGNSGYPWSVGPHTWGNNNPARSLLNNRIDPNQMSYRQQAPRQRATGPMGGNIPNVGYNARRHTEQIARQQEESYKDTPAYKQHMAEWKARADKAIRNMPTNISNEAELRARLEKQRIAAEAQARIQQEEKMRGLNKEHLLPKTTQPGYASSRTVSDHINRFGRFSVISNRGVEALSVTTTTKEVVQPANNALYANAGRQAVVVNNNDLIVDSRELQVRAPVTNMENAYNIALTDDGTIVEAEKFSHGVEYLEMKVHKLDGYGKELIEASKRISDIVKDKKTNQTKLTGIQIALDDFSPLVRKAVQAQILSAWNSMAKVCLVDPENPENALVFDDFDSLMCVYPGANQTKLTAKVAVLIDKLMAASVSAYKNTVETCMGQALESVFGRKCGFISPDENPKTLNCLAAFDNIPIVVGKDKRVRDIALMSDEEKKQLVELFTKDYILQIRRKNAIVTNLNFDDILDSERINVVNATDIPVAQYLRTVLKKDVAVDLYSRNDAGVISHIATCGMASNGNGITLRVA